MSSLKKNRRIVAFQSRYGSEIMTIYKCGDCQCYFPSLQSIHNHFKSCVNNLDTVSRRNQTPLEKHSDEVAKQLNKTIKQYLIKQSADVHLIEEASHVPLIEEASNLPLNGKASDVPLKEEASSVPRIEKSLNAPAVEDSDVLLIEEASNVPLTEEASHVPLTEEASSIPLIEEFLNAPAIEEHSDVPLIEEDLNLTLIEEVVNGMNSFHTKDASSKITFETNLQLDDETDTALVDTSAKTLFQLYDTFSERTTKQVNSSNRKKVWKSQNACDEFIAESPFIPEQSVFQLKDKSIITKSVESSNRHMFQLENISSETQEESINAPNRDKPQLENTHREIKIESEGNLDSCTKESTVEYLSTASETQTHQEDPYNALKFETLDILVGNQLKLEENSFSISRMENRNCVFTNASREDSTKLNVKNVTQGSFANSETMLDGNKSDITISFSTPAGTLMRLSKIRKRKPFDEQNCHMGTSLPMLTSFTNVNTHTPEKYPKINTGKCVNDYSNCKKSVLGKNNVEKNADERKSLQQELVYEKQTNHRNCNIMSVTQYSVGNVNNNQSHVVECLKETDGTINMNNKTETFATTLVTIGDKDTDIHVTNEEAALSKKRWNVSDFNTKNSGIDNAEVEIIDRKFLEQSNSVYIKCEETGNCVALVDISSSNDKKTALEHDLNCIKVREEDDTKGTKCEKVTKDNNMKTDQQPSGSNMEACTKQPLVSCSEVCMGEYEVGNKSNTIKQNLAQVLITYNGNGNKDLNLECEDSDTHVENNLLPRTTKVFNKPYILDSLNTIKTLKTENKLDYMQEENISKEFQYNLKRLSVTVPHLNTTETLTKNMKETFKANANKLPGNDDRCNKYIDKIVSQNVLKSTEATERPILSNLSRKRKYSLRESTIREDIKTKRKRSNKDNCDVDSIMESTSGEHSNVKTANHKDDSEESSTTDTSEDSDSDEIFELCDKCNTHFTSLSCYINHLILFHHPVYTRKHVTKCPICPRKFDSYFNCNLKSHVRFTHELDELKCLKCEKRFETYPNLQKHVKICQADFPTRTMAFQSLLYTRSVQCKRCKTFHIYRPSKNSAAVLDDIIQTLPGDQEVKALREKNEKLLSNVDQKIRKDNLKCTLCKTVFSHIKCALNHAITVHMISTMKKTCALFRKATYGIVCDFCKEIHKVVCIQSKRMRRLLSMDENPKEYSEELQSNDRTMLLKIRDGLVKCYSYENKIESFRKLRGNHFCKECNTDIGPFLCGLNHMIVVHFDRGSIDQAMKTCFFDRKIKKCKYLCKTYHYFSVSDMAKLKHYLAYESYDNTDCREKTFPGPIHTENAVVTKLREILVFETLKSSTEVVLKTRVNVVLAKTHEEISKDMEYRVAKINGQFICRLCHTEYSHYACCKSHVLTEHSFYFRYRKGSEVFTCPKCIVHFHSLHFLDDHLEKAHNIYKFTCTKCDKRFNTYNDYNSHLKHGKKFIQANFNDKLSCGECKAIHNCTVQPGEEDLITSSSNENDIVYKNIRTVQTKHVDDSQSSSDLTNQPEQGKDSYSDVAFDGQNFVCLICLDKFEELTCCFTHIVMQHYQKANFVCSLCQKTSRQKSAHLFHMKMNHELDVWYCHHCYLGFEEFILRDKHAEHCKTQTIKAPDNVNKNICLKCYGIHVHVSECDINSSCDECELGFASIKCAKNHFYTKHFQTWIILASKENGFKCPCGKEVLTKSALTFHLEIDHSQSSKLNKTIEGKAIQIKDPEKSKNINYDSYFKVHEELGKKCVGCEHVHIIDANTGRNSKRQETVCKICQKHFSVPACLQNHMLIAHTDINQSHQTRQCVGCGHFFAGPKILKRHQNETMALNNDKMQKSEHKFDKMCRRNVGLVKCDKCNEIHQHLFSTEEKKLKNSKSPKEIRETRRKHEETIKKLCKCSSCDLVVANHRELIAHRTSVHGKMKDEKGVICQICNQKLDKNVFYSEHLKQVHCQLKFVKGEIIDDFSSNFSCVYCEKKFSFPIDVQMHLRSAHFEKPLLARTHYRSDLKGLMMKGVSILQCPVCFKIRTSVGSILTLHIASHFKEVVGKVKEKKNFVCDICGKSFRCKTGLENHTEKHSGIRRFKCHICDKSFISRPNLDTHSLVHKEKKEQCKVCMMKFTLPHHVRAHMKRKHPNHV